MLYLAISIGLTVWVGRTLHSRGRVFIVDAADGNETLADSINGLLVVGFYLLNFGFVTLALRYGAKPHSLSESIEFLATKVGLVLIVLGVMHFFNLWWISKMRRRAKDESRYDLVADARPTFAAPASRR
jgi:hypothetical protein